MKKLLLLSAILVGAASASQAGGIHFGINLPLPPLPGVIISHRAPVVVERPCVEPQVVVAPPVSEPRVVVRDDYYRDRYVRNDYYRDDHRRYVVDRHYRRCR